MSGGEAGFALIVVIWAIGILALLFATYIGEARYRAIEAAALARRARADLLVQAGISIGVHQLVQNRAARQQTGGPAGSLPSALLCAPEPGAQIALSIADEGGKVDLNAADRELLEALLSAINPSSGTNAVRSILALREAAQAKQQAQGIVGTAGPAFRSILELHQLPSVGPQMVNALLPVVTVHSKATGVDPDVAPADLLRILSPGGARSRAEALRAMPSAFATRSPGSTFLVSVEAMIPGGRAARDAVVELVPDAPMGFRILEQREGLLRSGPSSGGLAPC